MRYLLFSDTVEYTNDSFDEVLVRKDVVPHRLQLKSELIDIFKQDDILSYDIRVTLIDPRGQEELGTGEGVIRDVLCSFFNEFITSNTVGCDEVVPSIRHDMAKDQWEAVGRMMIYGFRIGYFPLRFSPVFLVSTLFGEDCVSHEMMLSSFKLYISLEERDNISSMLQKFEEENEEALLETLSAYHCYRKPSEDNLSEIIFELGHQELIQKPRYAATCISNIFKLHKSHPFTSKDKVLQFYEKGSVSCRKIVKLLKLEEECNDIQRAVFNHLTRFIKSLDKKDLLSFLRFVTGGDILPQHAIKVRFCEQVPRAPRARSCVPSLEIADTYTCYNDLAEEFVNVLKSPDSYLFSFA